MRRCGTIPPEPVTRPGRWALRFVEPPSDEAPGLSDLCPCHTRGKSWRSCAPTEWPTPGTQGHDITRPPLFNQHRRTGSLTGFLLCLSPVHRQERADQPAPGAREEPGECVPLSCGDCAMRGLISETLMVRVREKKVLLRNLPQLSAAERRSLETNQGLEADDPPRSRPEHGRGA